MNCIRGQRVSGTLGMSNQERPDLLRLLNTCETEELQVMKAGGAILGRYVSIARRKNKKARSEIGTGL
jgi:hypothetical protein